MPPETENAQKNLLHPKRLSIHRLLFGHFHWRCLFCSLLIAICALHVGYCQIYGPISQYHSLNHSPGPCSHGYNLIPMALGALIYLVYLSECWHYRTHICSLPRMGTNQIVEFASAMRNAVPVVWWKSVSYHYLRRTRQVARYRNGDVITRSQVYYERVNSHQSGNVFLYDQSGYKDISKELAGLNKFSMVRIRLSKGFVFACLQAANEFEEQRTRFFNENEMLDDYMEVHEGFDLANLPFIERALIFPERKAGESQKWQKFLHWILRRPIPPPAQFSASKSTLLLPWWFSAWAFWPASLILLSWPIRMIAECRAGNLHFQITKLFGTNYLSPSSVNYTGPLTRTSTMDSRELELANRQNYLIVPSYSEAILLDPYQNEASAQSNNFFRQFFSSPRRNPVQPPISHFAPSVDYGSFRGPKDAQKGPRNGPPMRSHSIGCFIDQNNMENGFQHQNGHRHHQRHLPRPSTLINSQRRNQSRRQPPRSITFCEGIINNVAQQREDETEECSDRMPLLTAGNRRQRQFIDGNHQMPTIPCAIFQQMAEHPTEMPNEPPPPYEIALRYCSPIYQRLRQSVHSISSMFSRSASGRDLRQIYVNDGMQGPSPSNY